jgi:hypothetical protein
LRRSRLGLRNEALLFLHMAYGPCLHFVSVAVVAFNDSFSLSEAKWLLCISLPRTAASRIAVGTSRTARLVVQRMSSFETRRLVKYGSSPQHVGKVRRQQRPDQKIGRRGPNKIRGGPW